MKFEGLVSEAIEAARAGTRLTLTKKKDAKMPSHFPRGELLFENFDGRNVYSYDPLQILGWLVAMDLVKIERRKP